MHAGMHVHTTDFGSWSMSRGCSKGLGTSRSALTVKASWVAHARDDWATTQGNVVTKLPHACLTAAVLLVVGDASAQSEIQLQTSYR